jgi:hypothetical protein
MYSVCLIGGRPGDTGVFNTLIVPEKHQSRDADRKCTCGAFHVCECTIPAYAYCVPRFACHSGLMGGMPGDVAVFDTENVTETTQS